VKHYPPQEKTRQHKDEAVRLQQEAQASMQQLQDQIAEKEAALAAVTKVGAGAGCSCVWQRLW
jgi:peptidoglycan hydrolase CwlO-like protein